MSGLLKKYGLRVMASVLIYFFFRLTSENASPEVANDPNVWPIILIYAILVVLCIWEVCDMVIRYFTRTYAHDLTSSKRLGMLFLTATAATFPLVVVFIYFENFYLKVWLNYILNPAAELLPDTIQGFVVTWLVISVEILRLYYRNMRFMEVERTRMQKELIRTQYESLKNQVDPHFLFNNFSVLTALIHKDPDLAADFVTQLSKLYRYILDNNKSEMISLEKELGLLDSYLFLLKIRHEDSIEVTIDVDLQQDKYFLPTLSLQMLIENAVKHNRFSAQEPLRIRIYNEDQSNIVVQNVLNPKAGLTNTTKIGLENIKNRYDLKSPQKVVIYRTDTYFKVKLPIFSSLKLA